MTQSTDEWTYSGEVDKDKVDRVEEVRMANDVAALVTAYRVGNFIDAKSKIVR